MPPTLLVWGSELVRDRRSASKPCRVHCAMQTTTPPMGWLPPALDKSMKAPRNNPPPLGGGGHFLPQSVRNPMRKLCTVNTPRVSCFRQHGHRANRCLNSIHAKHGKCEGKLRYHTETLVRRKEANEHFALPSSTGQRHVSGEISCNSSTHAPAAIVRTSTPVEAPRDMGGRWGLQAMCACRRNQRLQYFCGFVDKNK